MSRSRIVIPKPDRKFDAEITRRIAVKRSITIERQIAIAAEAINKFQDEAGWTRRPSSIDHLAGITGGLVQ